MPEPIGEIPVQITGDFSSLQKDLAQAEAIAQKSAQSIAGAFNQASTGGLEKFGQSIGEFLTHPIESAQAAVGSLVTALGPMGLVAASAATAVVALGTAVTDLVLAEGAAAEETSNLANRLNLSFDETKKLSEMAEVAGVSLGGLNIASRNLANALEDANGSGKKVAEALRGIGIDVSKTLPSLVDVLEKLAAIPDANERVSASTKILGRSAVELEPLLRDFAALKKAIEELGGTIDKEGVEKLKKADDAGKLLELSWRHLKETLAATFAPAVTAGLETLTHLLSGVKTDTLENQIDQLTREIQELGEQAKDTGFSLAKMFAQSTGMGGIEAESAATANLIKQQKESALQQLQAAKRSKEYNAELEKLEIAAERAAATRKQHAAEEAKKYADALHKQNLEDIKKEEKAREDAAKAGEKLNEDFIKAGEKLEEQGRKTQVTFDKAWYQYVLETRKAIGITDEAKHKLGELADISVDLKDRLPPAILAAYEAGLKLNDAVRKLGIDAKASGTELIAAFDVFAESGKGNLEQIEIAWSKVSGQIEKIGRDNLPLAIAEYQKYIGLLVEHGAAQGQVLQAEQLLLELVVKSKELRGEAATEEIVNLELIRLRQEALTIQTRALGDVYVGLIRTFEDAFDSLGKGIAEAIIHGKNLGDVFKKIGEQIYSDIVHLIVEGAFKQLKAALIDNIDLFGKLGKSAASAAKDISTTTLGGIGGTGIPTGGGAKAPSGGAPSTGGGGLLSKAGDVAGVVSAVSDVIANFQFYAMNKSLDIIVKHTLETVNELRNWRRDAWEQQTNLFLKLDDMWNEIRNVVEILRLVGQSGFGNGEANADLAQAIADAINSRPHSSGDTQAALDAQEQAYNDVIHASDGVAYGLQSLTPQIENLDRAVSSAGNSLTSFVEDYSKSVAPMLAVADQMTGFHGYDATPGSGNNSVAMISPESIYGFHGYDATPGSGINAISGTNISNKTQGFAPGNNAGEKNIGVQVIAVDPSGRQIANATIKGLEERGIRVR